MLNTADGNGKTSEMSTIIEEADALDVLENLQSHENEVSSYQVFIQLSVFF